MLRVPAATANHVRPVVLSTCQTALICVCSTTSGNDSFCTSCVRCHSLPLLASMMNKHYSSHDRQQTMAGSTHIQYCTTLVCCGSGCIAHPATDQLQMCVCSAGRYRVALQYDEQEQQRAKVVV
eukprot:18888-Heterococcus_DN1.PRE.8